MSAASPDSRGGEPDWLIVATPNRLPFEIRHLCEAGLRIEGALRLYRAAEYWDRKWMPEFLIDQTGDPEMFERLESLCLSVYHRLGQARLMVGQVEQLCHKEYAIDPPTSRAPQEIARFMGDLMRASVEDRIALNAVTASVVLALTSSLDALAGIAALVLNLDYSIWNATFWKLRKALTVARETASPTNDHIRLKREVANVILPIVDRDGRSVDWVDQLFTYRHVYAHRPELAFAGSIEQGEAGFRNVVYLLRDPYARPSKIIPHSLGQRMLERNDWASRRAEFLDEPIEKYCAWANAEVVGLADRTMASLTNVYEERNEKPRLFENDSAGLLARKTHQKRTRFVGLPQQPATEHGATSQTQSAGETST